MIQSLVTSAVVFAFALVGVGVQLYFTRRRWKKQDEEIARVRAERDTEFSARTARLERALAVPRELTPWQPDPRESEDRLQRILAEMEAAAHDPEVERMLAELDRAEARLTDSAASAPVAPRDLRERVSERLSEAGYAGGPLRVAAVECVDATHVVVHLETVAR